MKNILFICKFNRFRSTLAEAYFNKRVKELELPYVAKSAGLFRGNAISDSIRNQAFQYGLKLKSNPEGLSVDILSWQDVIVVVADDVPTSIFIDHRINT